MVNGIKEYEFQNECVDFLIDRTYDENSKNVITVKAPTGAGKTVILIKYIDAFLKNTNKSTAFIWLCPGNGELEEQSRYSMKRLAPHLDSRSLPLSLMSGFTAGSTTFINWELVNKKGNNSIKDGEKPNLFDRIKRAHDAGTQFIVIIDEEHCNNTAKAEGIISAFSPKNRIRVSATPQKVDHQEFYEIKEDDVIRAGLITSAIFVNELVDEAKEIANDYDYLLDLADAKRKEILRSYNEIGSDVRPLVLIQFPSGQLETITAVEAKLESMGYTYDNGMVNIWMSNNKVISDDLQENNGTPAFLLMKQAVSTGWDCPRAKILVKLREGGSEQFQIQTIGRIRRMPEKKHYGLIPCLDLCYLYTLDTQYKQGMLSEMDKAYQVRQLFAKEEVKKFKLVKEFRNLDTDRGLGTREILKKVFEHMKKKYSLVTKKTENHQRLLENGYILSHEIDSKVVQGLFRTTDELANASSSSKADKKITVKTVINTHTHGIYLMHSVDEIKTTTGIEAAKIRTILQRMFKKGKRDQYKILSLDNNDFYAFIINNAKKLKQEFREVMAEESGKQLSLVLDAKTGDFKIPEMEFYKFSAVKKVRLMERNAYKEYTNEFITDKVRSTPERLFEKYCDSNSAVEWYYKNGDAGQDYMSVLYIDGFQKQWLFYPDYIIRMTNGDIWIIETKGGMQHGHSKNVDEMVRNKFAAMKMYAEKYDIHWGFVRDVDDELYFNNTVYSDIIDTMDEWKPLEDIF